MKQNRYYFTIIIISLSILFILSCRDSSIFLLPADTTLPSISITYPEEGDSFGNEIITIRGEASDNLIIDQVILTIGNEEIEAVVTNNSWQLEINTIDYGLGEFTIIATVYDGSGNTATDQISVMFNNFDLLPPTVIIDNGSDWVNYQENQAGVPLSISSDQANLDYRLTATNCFVSQGTTGTLDDQGEANLTLTSFIHEMEASISVVLIDALNRESNPGVDTVQVDLVNPVVNSSDPFNGETNVPVDTEITVVFSENIDTNTIRLTNISLSPSMFLDLGTFDPITNTLLIYPDNNLDLDTEYTLTLETGLTDLAGNNLNETLINFRTEP